MIESRLWYLGAQVHLTEVLYNHKSQRSNRKIRDHSYHVQHQYMNTDNIYGGIRQRKRSIEQVARRAREKKRRIGWTSMLFK